MKNNTKKGFTLVELLVVIAILAILATVSVVGYTSFIERATVSNDQNIAAQLNQFLIAVKADSKGPYYEKLQKDGVTPDNVTEITDYILKDCGLNILVAQSEQYGYHFYFDWHEQKYVLLHDKDAVDAPTGFEAFLKPAAAGKPNYLSPSNCFTKEDGRYCLVETESDWAKLLKRYNEVTSKEDLQKLYDDAQAMVNENKATIPGFAYLIETTTFVTEKGNYVVANTDKNGNSVEHNAIVIQPEATKNEEGQKNEYIVAGNKVGLDADDSVTIGDEYPLFTPTDTEKEYVIELPKDVTYISPNFANVANEKVTTAEGETDKYSVTIKINKNAEDISDTVEIGIKVEGATFVTNQNVVIEINSEGTTITIEGESYPISAKNQVTDFKVSVSHDNAEKFDASETKADIAWDGGTFDVIVSDFKGSVEGMPVVSEEIDWDVVVLGDKDAEGNDVDYSGCVDFKDGKLTLKAVEGKVPAINQIELTARAVASENLSKKYTIRVVRLTDKDVTLGGDDWNSAVAFIYGTTDKDSLTTNVYDVVVSNPDYNHRDSKVKLDETISIVSNNAALSVNPDFSKLTYTAGNDAYNAIDLTITVGQYLKKTVTVSMYNGDKYVFGYTGTNNKEVGSGSVIHTTTVANATDVNGLVEYDNNLVTFADLFTAKKGVDLTNIGKLTVVVYKPLQSGQTEFSKRFKLPDPANAQPGELNIVANNITIDTSVEGWENTPILDFNNTGTCCVTVFADGVRVSNDITLNVVEGWNIRTYSDITSKYATQFNWITYTKNYTTKIDKDGNVTDVVGTQQTISTSYQRVVYGTPVSINADGTTTMDVVEVVTGPSMVLLRNLTGDAKMTKDGFFAIYSEATFYGNNFDMDISNGIIKHPDSDGFEHEAKQGVIGLYGTLRDVRVLGAIYPDAGARVTEDYGTAAVVSKSSVAKIENCYISNCRSALRVEGKTTVKDTVFFGGSYANIDMISGELVVNGTVVTIQQPVKSGDKTVIGMGIACWFNDTAKVVTVNTGANFNQYNFMSSALTSSMPSIEYLGYKVLDVKEPWNEVMADKDGQYTNYMFFDKNNSDQKYVASNMLSIDKYYGVYVLPKVDEKHTGGCSGQHKNITLTFKTPYALPKGTTVTFTYDNDKYDCTSTTDNGTIVITLANGATAGATIATHKFNLPDGGYTSGDDFTITVKDASGNEIKKEVLTVNGSSAYGKPTIVVSADADTFAQSYAELQFLGMGLTDGLAYKGIHSSTPTVDLRMYDNTVPANQKLFQEYLAMTTGNYKDAAGSASDANGNNYSTYSNYYTSDNFHFNSNGTFTFLNVAFNAPASEAQQ